MAQATSPLAFDLSAGVLIGLGLSGTTFAVIMGVIGRHTTPERRSLALGIASAGGSFGQFAVLPVGQMLITTYGWQSALVLLACGVGLIAPLAYAMADGHKPAAGGGQSVAQALREARRRAQLPLPVLGLFRVRLPDRLHHAAPAVLPGGRRVFGQYRDDRGGADRPFQHLRLVLVRLGRRALQQEESAGADLRAARRGDPDFPAACRC